MNFTPNLTKNQWKYGMLVMCFGILILPDLLYLALYGRVNAAQVNFISYFITAAATVYILKKFLKRNLDVLLAQPFWTVYRACGGYVAFLGLSSLVSLVIRGLSADFTNLNDVNVDTMLQGDLRIMVMTVTILAPIVEECFYRGLLFRGIYNRSPVAAWCLSMGLFAAAHVLGYLGTYSPLGLVLSFIQYLPAGFVLCMIYQRTGTIIGPMLTHSLINVMAVYASLR